jgi:hypothetical protein
METFPEHLAQELTNVSEVLSPLRNHGWEVRIKPSKISPLERFEVRIKHALSSDFAFDRYYGDEERTLARFRQVVTSREAVAIETAPEIMRHAVLVGGLRACAQAEEWPESIFTSVITMLWGANVLTRDEWSWLREVGPISSLTESAEQLDTPDPDQAS